MYCDLVIRTWSFRTENAAMLASPIGFGVARVLAISCLALRTENFFDFGTSCKVNLQVAFC